MSIQFLMWPSANGAALAAFAESGSSPKPEAERMAARDTASSDLRLRLDSEEADDDQQPDDGCVEFPQKQQQQQPPPPPPRPTTAEKPLRAQTQSKKSETPGEISFQEQLRLIAFGGSRQKRTGPTGGGGGGGGGGSVEKSAAKTSVASSVVGEEDQPSTLDLIAKMRDSLTAYQTAAPPVPVENDVDDYNYYNYGDKKAAYTRDYPADDYRGGGLYDEEVGDSGFGYDAARPSGGYDNGFKDCRDYTDDGEFSADVRYNYDFEDAQFQQQQQQQQPGSMLLAVRARWAAQREEELDRLKEMSSQRQLESQLREETRQLNENLHEKQLEVQAMTDQLDLLRRLNEQTKSDLMAAVEKGDFQASELKLVMEEDRQVLEVTRRENLELKTKIEDDERQMRGLEGRLAGLERQLQSLQSENGHLAQQMRETSLSVQAGAMERQEAGRMGQQLVVLETELMRLRREVANQHLVSAAGSRKAAAVASAAAATVAEPTRLTTTTATASTMTTPRVAAVDQPATIEGPSRLQRALQMNLAGKSKSSTTAAVEPVASPPPPPPPPRLKQQLLQQEPPVSQPPPPSPPPPPPPRPQRSAEDEQISDRVRGFLTRMQTPPPTPKPQQQQQQQQQQEHVPQTRQQPLIRRPIRSGSFGAGGSGGGNSIVERLRAEFRDAHSAEIKRLAASTAAPSPPKPPMTSATPAPQNPQPSSRQSWTAGQPGAQQHQQLQQQQRRSTASSRSNILQGLEAMNSFRSGGGGAGGGGGSSATGTAVPRLSLETGAGGESMRSESRRHHLRDYAETRELTASARKYADSIVTRYLNQQGAC